MSNVVKYRAYIVVAIVLFVLSFSFILVMPTVSAQETPQEEVEQDDEEQFNPWESGVIHEFPNGAELRYVDFEDGEATVYIYLEQSLTNERAEVGSATAESGVVPSTTVSLQEGENVVSVQLQDPNLEGVSVASGGETYAHLGDDSRITLSQDVPYPWVLSVGGMVLVFGFVVAFNQFRKRRSKTAKNAIKT